MARRPNNKTVSDVAEERDAGKARLINYGNNQAVELQWGMNAETSKEQIFIIRIGDKEAWLNAEEVKRFLRWV